jgi:hypothetical protein
MKKSALRLTKSEATEFTVVPPLQHKPPRNIIPHPCSAGVTIIDQRKRSERAAKRRRKLVLFIGLEIVALFFLALALTGATSEIVRHAGLLPILKLALIPTGLVVAIIPVIFFGVGRDEHRYRARNYREGC